jgi:hypothetical protein
MLLASMAFAARRLRSLRDNEKQPQITVNIADFQLPIADLVYGRLSSQSVIGNWQSEIGNVWCSSVADCLGRRLLNSRL